MTHGHNNNESKEHVDLVGPTRERERRGNIGLNREEGRCVLLQLEKGRLLL